MRIGWAMQISPGGQAGEKSGKDATPGHTVAAVYDRRTRLSKNLPPSTGKMPVGPTASPQRVRPLADRMAVLRRSSFALRNFSALLVDVATETTGRMPVGPTGKMPVLRSFFARRDFLRNSAGAHFHHELSRCHVFLVFLVATDLGRIETPLR